MLFFALCSVRENEREAEPINVRARTQCRASCHLRCRDLNNIPSAESMQFEIVGIDALVTCKRVNRHFSL